jgi:hypothetical protein
MKGCDHGHTESNSTAAARGPGRPRNGHIGLSEIKDSQETEDIKRNPPLPATEQLVAGEVVSSTSFWSLPLPAFVAEALERSGANGEDWQALFAFVRLVRSYFNEGVKAEDVFDKVAPIIHKLGDWQEYFAEATDDDEAFTLFVSTWGKVRYRADETPLTNAVAKAKAYPLGTLRSQKRRVAKYDAFVSVAGWLQVSMGDRPIMLPCRAVAEALKTTPKMISIWRQWAIEDEFLIVVKAHRFNPGGKSDATQFRFDTSRWKILSKVAQSGTNSSFSRAQQGIEYPTA